MSTHEVVFTDIDGTLNDINTAEYGKKTKKLISIMKEKNIPLILTSAKQCRNKTGGIEMKNSVRRSIGNQNIIKVNRIGPSGWENAIHKFVLELN